MLVFLKIALVIPRCHRISRVDMITPRERAVVQKYSSSLFPVISELEKRPEYALSLRVDDVGAGIVHSLAAGGKLTLT